MLIVISPGIDINRCKISGFLKKNLNKIITDLDLFFELNKECINYFNYRNKWKIYNL